MLPDNPLRGEASVEIAGETYRLVFDVSAFIFAQQATGKSVMEMVGAFGESPDDLIILRMLFWAGLQRHHSFTVSEVEDLLSDAGLAKARAVVSEALAAAFGTVSEDGDAGNVAKPKRKRGTG